METSPEPGNIEEIDEAEVAEALESLEENKYLVIEIVRDMKGELPLRTIMPETEFFHPKTLPTILKQIFDLDINAPMEEIRTQGIPDSPDEEEIIITTFGTNEEGVFIHKFKEPGDKVNWIMGPLNYPESL